MIKLRNEKLILDIIKSLSKNSAHPSLPIAIGMEKGKD